MEKKPEREMTRAEWLASLPEDLGDNPSATEDFLSKLTPRARQALTDQRPRDEWGFLLSNAAAAGGSSSADDKPPLSEMWLTILSALRMMKGERVRGKAIARTAGYTEGTVRRHLKPLQTAGYIDKTADGYAITPAGEAAVG